MKNWAKELINNKQPLKMVGGLTFQIENKMEQEHEYTIKHCETCNEDYEVHKGDDTCEYCGDTLD